MVKILKEANRIISLWRDHGPGTTKIDLQLAFQEIVLPSSSGDKCEIVHDTFPSFEGLMARQGTSRDWVIGINTSIDYPPRRNFTLAHEIGHFIAHRLIRDRFECTFENLNDFENHSLEAEANGFASQLLIPPDIVRQFDMERVFEHEAVTDLSNLLGVSMEAAAFRWINLTTRPIGFAKSRDSMIDKGRASAPLYSMGVWFKQGIEIPEKSVAAGLTVAGEQKFASLAAGVWSPIYPCRESSYATKRDGYVYTYLDFDKL